MKMFKGVKKKIMLENFFRSRRSIVPSLIIANILIFVLQIIFGNSFTEAFLLNSSRIFVAPWILFTHMFLHAGFNHLFFNMYGLLIFGPILESRIGKKRFLFTYLLSGLVAAIISSFFYPKALGASAAIMGIIGCLIIILPKLRLLMFFMIPMPLWAAGIVWALMDAVGIFYPTGVGNIAHIVGMATGLVIGFSFRNNKKKADVQIMGKTHLDDEDIEIYYGRGRI